MTANTNHNDRENKNHEQHLYSAAGAALPRYGLDGLCVASAAYAYEDQDGALFLIEVPDQHDRMHPYLGRLGGKQLVLRVRPCAAQSIAEVEAELALLAMLLRDTELALPEPVPACDGSLVVRVEEGEPVHCVLFRLTAERHALEREAWRLPSRAMAPDQG
jgi:hypothetical protein